jgi:putative transposase
MQTDPTAGHSPIGSFQRTCYVVSALAAQSPRAAGIPMSPRAMDSDRVTCGGAADRVGAASPRLQPWGRLRRAKARIVAPGWDDVAVRYRSTNKTVYSAKYHLIWCPKYRRRVLVGGVDERVKVIIGDVAAEVIEVEVMPDHVHLLAEVPPTGPLSRLVGLAKGRSSRLLGMEFPACGGCRCCGSPSWVVSTVGGAPLEVVRRYVENHKARS